MSTNYRQENATMGKRWFTLLSISIGMSLFAVTPAQAQYTNPHTGTTWNNPTSSLIDTMLLNNQRAMMMRNSLMAGNLSNAAVTAAYKRTVRAGALKIKKGQATTRLGPLTPFDTEAWITRCGAKTPEVRRQYAEEIKVQRDIWNQEVRARNASPNDMASLMGVAFILGWEAHSGGQKATDAQYRWVVNDFRRTLMKDPYFQGMSAAEKQYLYEQQMINATDAVRLWRQGQKSGDAAMQKSGRESGSRFLSRWWDEPVERLIATPTGFASAKK
jgi:hypothetical protein